MKQFKKLSELMKKDFDTLMSNVIEQSKEAAKEQEKPKSIIQIVIEGLSRRTKLRFANFYTSRKASGVNDDSIVHLWNKFVTKPEDYVFMVLNGRTLN